MKMLLTMLLTMLCSIASAQEPIVSPTITLSNGEMAYVTGHEHTTYSLRSGSANDPTLWSAGEVPGPTDRVLINEGTDISFCGDFACETLVIGGDMRMLDGGHVYYGTITQLPSGLMIGGTAAVPITSFAFHHVSMPYDPGDAGQMGNGVIWLGQGPQLYGKIKTPWTMGEVAPDWDPEDLLYVATTERHGGYRTIVAEYDGSGLVVANLTRSIRFDHVEGSIPYHTMQMVAPGGIYQGVEFSESGRTRKDIIGNSATNRNGRYGFHAHRCPSAEADAIDLICTVSHGALGWGLVNHSSRMNLLECVSADVFGAGIVNEAGHELGSAISCLSIGIHSDFGTINARETALVNGTYGDQGYGGQGYWGLSPRFFYIDCVSADTKTGWMVGARDLAETYPGDAGPVYHRYPDTSLRPGHTYPVELIGQQSFTSESGIWFAGDFRGPRSVADLVVMGATKHGIFGDYTTGFVVTGAEISGTGEPGSVGIAFPQSLLKNCRVDFAGLTIEGFDVGILSKGAALGTKTFTAAAITNCQTGLLLHAQGHPAANNVVTFTGEIDAPTPFVLFAPSNPSQGYYDRPNEFWWNGVRQFWDFQE